MIKKEKFWETLERGVDEIIDRAHLEKKLRSGRKLRVKLGIDPTSPHLHLGRSVQLLKLRDFQELGHKIVFVIGDFTGVIGDTSDKNAERPMLEADVVEHNMKTYEKQAGKILDMHKVEVRYNSQWLAKLRYQDIARQANAFSLAEFTARKNIADRLKKGNRISLRELLYPLMQGYDSVAIKADVEIGGTDQRFNLLAGRAMQQLYGQEPQDVITSHLINGLDGRKMSSTWGNTINIFDPAEEMFGKIMSMHDDLIIPYMKCCTRMAMDQIKEYEILTKSDAINPRDIKLILAREIVKMYWGEKGARQAYDHFSQVFQKGARPDNIPEKKVTVANIVDVLLQTGLVSSKNDARRLIQQKGIKKNDVVVTSLTEKVNKGDVLQKGKRFFVKIV